MSMIENADGPADFADFSQSLVLTAPDELDALGLGDVLAQAAAQHPMLTSQLTRVDGAWRFAAGTDFDAAAAVSEIASPHVPGTDGFAADLTRAFELASARLDPAIGRLYREEFVRRWGEATLPDIECEE